MTSTGHPSQEFLDLVYPALRLAGIPDDFPLWTGSCPCQPFSAAGQGKGAADERHLWPAWFRLIRESRPAIVRQFTATKSDVKEQSKMEIRDYNPSQGMAFQGDVSIVPLPTDIEISCNDEILPVAGRLILQEGEVTGHHHAIALAERPAPRELDEPNLVVERLISDALANKVALPSARLFRDPSVGEAMRERGLISRTDLIVGVLIVKTGSMCLVHEEHDGIRIPVGAYLVGRQVESAGAEELRVAD
jgi:hypothetical protein